MALLKDPACSDMAYSPRHLPASYWHWKCVSYCCNWYQRLSQRKCVQGTRPVLGSPDSHIGRAHSVTNLTGINLSKIPPPTSLSPCSPNPYSPQKKKKKRELLRAYLDCSQIRKLFLFFKWALGRKIQEIKILLFGFIFPPSFLLSRSYFSRLLYLDLSSEASSSISYHFQFQFQFLKIPEEVSDRVSLDHVPILWANHSLQGRGIFWLAQA